MCSTPVKGCLKQPSPTPTPMPECLHARKCVAFEAEGSAQIFLADEWDRTPTEPTRKLSYQDMMELREIQRSLPLANQPPDPVTGRAGRQYLSTVPISLLPLLPEAENSNKATTNATHVQAPGYSRTPPHRNLHAAATKSRPPDPSHFALPAVAPHSINHHNSHRKISNPTARRFEPKFTFLPLLDTPSSSSESSGATTPLASNSSSRSTSPEFPSDTDQTDPPTPSLTNASLDSPTSCASSLSPEPSFLQLPPRHLGYGDERFHLHFGPTDSYFPVVSDDVDMRGDDNDTPGKSVSNRLFPVSPHSAKKPVQEQSRSFGAPLSTIAAIKPLRKRNVIVVNGEEIDLDEDEDEDRRSSSGPVSETPNVAAATPARKRNVIIVNGEEVEIDDEDPSQSSSSDLAPSKFPSISTLSSMTKLDSNLRSMSLSAPGRHCNSTTNDKPPEPKTRDETKALPPSCLPSPPLTPSIDDADGSRPGRHSPPTPRRTQVSNGSFGSTAKPGGTAIGCGAEEFGLHIPLRFKRASNNASNTARHHAPFPYSGSS